MHKVLLHVLSLTPSPARENVFTILLGEAGGSRRLPILLGPIEARAIALALEEGLLERPLIHDLFREVLLHLDYIVQEVVITDLREEVFFAEMVLSDGLTLLTVDARPSDAIAMALRFGAELYANEALLEEAYLYRVTRKQGGPANAPEPPRRLTKPLQDYSVATLKQILQRVVAQEDYEQAARLRDEINGRNMSKSK